MRINRREALIAGTAAAAVAATGWWARYAVGMEFERHVAQVLGLEVDVATELIGGLRDQLGADYDARAAAFLGATTSPSRQLMPERLRREALEAFVGPLAGLEDGLVTPFVLARMNRSGRYVPCDVLQRRS